MRDEYLEFLEAVKRNPRSTNADNPDAVLVLDVKIGKFVVWKKSPKLSDEAACRAAYEMQKRVKAVVDHQPHISKRVADVLERHRKEIEDALRIAAEEIESCLHPAR